MTWTFKNQFPDLSGSGLLAFDLETKDPNLKERGCGGARKDGYVVGFSLANDKGFKAYYPLRHEGGGNVPDIQAAVRYLKDTLNHGVPVCGANLLYDFEWAKCDFDVTCSSPWYDVQLADPLLDENWPSYRLNAIAKRRLGLCKDEDILFLKGAEYLGYKSRCETEEKQKSETENYIKGNLWKLPAEFVGAYAEGDAELPIQIWQQQEKELKEQDLWSVFQLEQQVQRVLLKMRLRGVPVDTARAEEVSHKLRAELSDTMSAIKSRVGFEPEIWTAESLGKAFDAIGIEYPRTKSKKNKAGNEIGNKPSIQAAWLEAQNHPVTSLLLRARQLEKCVKTFVEDKLLDMAVDGRLYTSYHQVIGDRGGTKSFRFSSSKPNLQQIPARNEELADMVRGLFVAEPGCRWLVSDIASQEPRLTVHYAYKMGLRASALVRHQYVTDPKTDYHQVVANITGLPRKIAKSINLGMAYGMGTAKFAAMYGFSQKEAQGFFDTYHERLPFVKLLSNQCQSQAKAKGYIRTLMGHHCHFNLYGPANYTDQKETPVLHKQEAIEKYGMPVTQYFVYTALNRLIQGSAAGMMKKQMVDCDDAGYTPYLTVHDELDFANIESDRQIKEIHDIMQNSVQLEVPVLLDTEVGPSWGQVEKIEIKDLHL